MQRKIRALAALAAALLLAGTASLPVLAVGEALPSEAPVSSEAPSTPVDEPVIPDPDPNGTPPTLADTTSPAPDGSPPSSTSEDTIPTEPTPDVTPPPSTPEDTAPTEPAPDSVPITTETIQLPTAGDWDTLWAWLMDNKETGGTIRLTDDVYMPSGTLVSYVNGGTLIDLKPVEIDCGAHTIYVEQGAQLRLEYAKGLTLSGIGGEAGLIHVMPGGYFSANLISLLASDGSALVQEEGGWAFLDRRAYPCTVDGLLSWAETPILSTDETGDLSGKGIPIAVIPEGQEAGAELLPERLEVQLNYRGDILRVEGGVTWETEAQADALAQRQRTLLTGAFTGPLEVDRRDQGAAGDLDMAAPMGEDCVHYSRPNCVAVFPVDGAALIQCSFQARGDILIANVNFMFDGEPTEARLLWSADEGQTWTQAKAKEAPEDGADGMTVVFDQRPPDGAWFLVELVYPQGDGTQRLVHTDTIVLSDGVIAPMTWGDGHRGGGEQLGGGNAISDSGSSGSDDEPEVTPPPSLTRPPAGQSGSSGQSSGNDNASDVRDDPADSSSRPHITVSIVTPPSTAEPGETPAVSTPPAESQAPQETEPPAETQPPITSQPPVETDPTPSTSQAPDTQSSDTPGQDGTPYVDAVAPVGPSTPAPEPIPEETPPSAEEPADPDSTGGPENAGGLTPAAQAAVGVCAVLVVGAGATAVLNPDLLRRLLKRRR